MVFLSNDLMDDPQHLSVGGTNPLISVVLYGGHVLFGSEIKFVALRPTVVKTVTEEWV
jgi:hypothetical protein